MKIWNKKIEILQDVDCVSGDAYDWVGLKEDIEKHGIKEPIVLTRFTNAVVDGNHRLAIARLIYPPDKEIPCVYEDKEFWKGYKDKLRVSIG